MSSRPVTRSSPMIHFTLIRHLWAPMDCYIVPVSASDEPTAIVVPWTSRFSVASMNFRSNKWCRLEPGASMGRAPPPEHYDLLWTTPSSSVVSFASFAPTVAAVI
ncbi:hypothetical protein FA13DRAFT_1733362 [Coprinellus micaceus]|uniref:Uncharacterized protein n=1 Tax=Coprinellus micaceus TaxID=71717 RepID=A0A4Y7T9V1_COPMI|nr:hypothetical protein FA13DRAFT_1733362 [Coprinellus micaceus]